MQIRSVSIDEVDTLQKISISTFLDAFGDDNRKEDMDDYLEKSMSIESLTNQFKANSEFYFLQDQGEIIGYLKLNFGISQNEIKDGNTVEIERIYVTKEQQGKGYGELLLNKAIGRGIEKSLDFIWLGVWEHNTSAIRLYERLGFKVFDRHAFMLGTDKQTDIMMKKELRA